MIHQVSTLSSRITVQFTIEDYLRYLNVPTLLWTGMLINLGPE